MYSLLFTLSPDTHTAAGYRLGRANNPLINLVRSHSRRCNGCCSSSSSCCHLTFKQLELLEFKEKEKGNVVDVVVVEVKEEEGEAEEQRDAIWKEQRWRAIPSHAKQ